MSDLNLNNDLVEFSSKTSEQTVRPKKGYSPPPNLKFQFTVLHYKVLGFIVKDLGCRFLGLEVRLFMLYVFFCFLVSGQ